MRMLPHDAIHRATVNLVDIGGKELPVLAPVTSWLVGLGVLLLTNSLLRVLLGGMSVTTVFLSGVVAVFAGRWVAQSTGGDHRLGDLYRTVASELSSQWRYRTRLLRTRSERATWRVTL